MQKPATWGIVTTLKEDPRVVRRFVAHHLALGAQEIRLFFDDPEDAVAGELGHLERVKVVLCDDDHWRGQRPEAHQRRQKINVNKAYKSANVDWLIHIDADELIHSTADVAAELARVPGEQNVVGLPVAESFAGMRQGNNFFRYALPDTPRGRRIGHLVYGDVYPLLQGGLLSHTAGKFFVRTGVGNMELSIHAPFFEGRRETGSPSGAMTLLHLHSNDEDAWVNSVQRRLTRGAYQKKFHDDRKMTGKTSEGEGWNAYLSRIIETEGEDGLRAFHRRVCRFGKGKRPLRRLGALLKVNLWEDQKTAAVFPGSKAVATKSFAFNPVRQQFEAEVDFRGSRMIVYPDDNFTESELARGKEAEQEEADCIEALVSGKKTVLYDVGANSGIYSLLVACHARGDSTVHAFEPNPEMVSRLRQNIDINQYENVRLHQCALAGEAGTAELFLHGNLGQASLLGSSSPDDVPGQSAIEVPVSTLKAFAEERETESLYILKIDIEGAEPLCLAPFFETADRNCWPDYILYEHAHTGKWSIPPEQVFPPEAYCTERVFKHNTLIRRVGHAS